MRRTRNTGATWLGSYLELASLLYELGRQTEAAEPYRKALELEEDDPAVNNDLAWFLATSPEPSLRDAARAVRLAKKVVAARPESANYRNTLGVAYYRSGDDRAAVAELEKAMSMQAGGTRFDWFFLAMAHWRLGDRDKARMCFDRAVQWMDQSEVARRRAVPLSRRGASDARRPRPALNQAARSLPCPRFRLDPPPRSEQRSI